MTLQPNTSLWTTVRLRADAAGNITTEISPAVVSYDTEEAWRLSLVPGTYAVDGTNTGCYEDASWAPVVRDVVTNHVPVAGTTYRNLIIQNTITPPAGDGDAWYVNCELQGPVGPGHLVKAYDPGRIRLHFTDCTFRPQNPDNSRVACIGRGYTWTRCKVSHVVDGFRVQDTNNPTGPCDVSIRTSYVDNLYWEQDSADGTHCDVGQISSGSGAVIEFNNLQGFIAPEYRPNFYGTGHANAVLMIKPDVGLITNLIVRGNKMNGGAYGVNIANKTTGTVRTLGNVGIFENNEFGTDIRKTRTISMPVSASATVTTGNVYTDTGLPVTVYRQG